VRHTELTTAVREWLAGCAFAVAVEASMTA
jgi:hypothetical protein